ncbi:hypothetical protein R1flu_000224 [Riccia fluitans]|uniref:Uncharacterized protein n=1 Tax=Riccia fluitans TaxID=41844 RepID=A0ABD1Y0R3_9MARC
MFSSISHRPHLSFYLECSLHCNSSVGKFDYLTVFKVLHRRHRNFQPKIKNRRHRSKAHVDAGTVSKVFTI